MTNVQTNMKPHVVLRFREAACATPLVLTVFPAHCMCRGMCFVSFVCHVCGCCWCVRIISTDACAYSEFGLYSYVPLREAPHVQFSLGVSKFSSSVCAASIGFSTVCGTARLLLSFQWFRLCVRGLYCVFRRFKLCTRHFCWWFQCFRSVRSRKHWTNQ